MSDIGKQVGERIRLIRKAHGLSQEQLALKANINISYMGQVERGEKNPTIDVVNKIAIALQLPLSQLLSIPTISINKCKQQSVYFQKIYHHLLELSAAEQKEIYKILKQIISFKHSKAT